MMNRIQSFLRLFDGTPDRLARRMRLFHFEDMKNQFKATITTDKSWGGKSEASFNLEERDGRTLGIFQGIISKEGNAEAHKLGFAALTLEQKSGEFMNCDEYTTLVLRAKPDNCKYAVTLRNANFLAPEIVYQGFFKASNCKEISSLILNFDCFLPTRAAHLVEHEHILDVPRFSGISLTICDRKYEGPFHIEIESIFVTNEPPDQASKPFPISEFEPDYFHKDDAEGRIKQS
mmetsp:Transcript_9009/g.13862  ORF Transcript_9009/g.13862 Transcript_9009/m.13862 type:complete len:233 (-) Transcript_9009:798-1496(-)